MEVGCRYLDHVDRRIFWSRGRNSRARSSYKLCTWSLRIMILWSQDDDILTTILQNCYMLYQSNHRKPVKSTSPRLKTLVFNHGSSDRLYEWILPNSHSTKVFLVDIMDIKLWISRPNKRYLMVQFHVQVWRPNIVLMCIYTPIAVNYCRFSLDKLLTCHAHSYSVAIYYETNNFYITLFLGGSHGSVCMGSHAIQFGIFFSEVYMERDTGWMGVGGGVR